MTKSYIDFDFSSNMDFYTKAQFKLPHLRYLRTISTAPFCFKLLYLCYISMMNSNKQFNKQSAYKMLILYTQVIIESLDAIYRITLNKC